LSEAERVEIADRHHAGETGRAIAAAIGRSPATVSRELRRNSIGAGQYRPFQAHRAAALRRRRPRLTKLAAHPELLAWAKDLLAQRWSPSQICRALRREFPDRPDWHLITGDHLSGAVSTQSLRLRRVGYGPAAIKSRRPMQYGPARDTYL
jgi:IS30 family transposase